MAALEAQARAELVSASDGGPEQLSTIGSLTDPARTAELVQHVLVGNNRVALQAAAEYCLLHITIVFCIHLPLQYTCLVRICKLLN